MIQIDESTQVQKNHESTKRTFLQCRANNSGDTGLSTSWCATRRLYVTSPAVTWNEERY